MHICKYTLNIIGFQAFDKIIAGPSKLDKTLSSNEPTKSSGSSSSTSSSPVSSSSSSTATSKDRIKIRVTKLNKGEYQKNALKSTPETQKLEEDVQDQLQKAGLDLGSKFLCFLQQLDITIYMCQCFECKMTKNGKQTIHEIPEFVSVTSELFLGLGGKIQVKIITAGYVDDKDDVHLLSAEDSSAFKNMIVSILV